MIVEHVVDRRRTNLTLLVPEEQFAVGTGEQVSHRSHEGALANPFAEFFVGTGAHYERIASHRFAVTKTEVYKSRSGRAGGKRCHCERQYYCKIVPLDSCEVVNRH